MGNKREPSGPMCPRCGKRRMNSRGYTPGGKKRYRCGERSRSGNAGGCGYGTTDVEHAADGKVISKQAPPKAKKFQRGLAGVKRIVITCAQNATPAHIGLKSLRSYCDHNNAELVIIPIRYKNPTSRWTESQRNEEVWAKEVQPYLCNYRKNLNENLVLLADVKVQPTAVSPLTGFEAMTHGESGILGHTKMQLRTIPTPQSSLPKILTTTGAITIPNYTDSRAGKQGEFHHSLSAIVVEIVGRRFHLRQLNLCSDGSFIDIDTEYFPDGPPRKAAPALGLVMGDTHFRFIDPVVEEATFGPGGIIETIDAQTLVFHDLLDGYAGNPHHRDNPFVEIAKRTVNWHKFEDEVRETVEWLVDRTGDRESVVVASNHDAFLRRWISSNDWRRDPDNAEFYLETALVMVRGTKMGEYGYETPDPFVHWVEQLKGDVNIRCLSAHDSFMLGPVECGQHGEKGPNGARATLRNLARIGVRISSGHGHSPGIEEGHNRVGTSTRLRLEYTSGPSSWLNTHGPIYANGRRALINIIDGEWRRAD